MRLFVKDYAQADSPAVRERCGMLSGVCGIIINIVLSASKFVIGALTNSVAITADALNNLTDCLTSLLTILGFRWSAKPADREHPFGHARIEYIISLAVAVIILVTGYEVMRSSIVMIITPEPLYFTPWAVAVLVFSMGAKYWMYLFNKNLGKQVKSDTLLAVGIDSRNDVVINIATLLSLVFTLLTDFVIDGYVGALIALVFLRSGYNVAKEALARIIGNPSDKHVAAKIKEIVKSHDGVLGIHDLVVHSYGPGRSMASIHVEIPMDMSLRDSYDMINNVRHAVFKQLEIPIVVQITPIDLADVRLQNIISLAQEVVGKRHSYLLLNEFRIIDSMPKPILVFDLEFPLEITRAEALIVRDSIAEEMIKILPQYDCDINIEYSYTE